jgi:hypothetical protein
MGWQKVGQLAPSLVLKSVDLAILATLWLVLTVSVSVLLLFARQTSVLVQMGLRPQDLTVLPTKVQSAKRVTLGSIW